MQTIFHFIFIFFISVGYQCIVFSCILLFAFGTILKNNRKESDRDHRQVYVQKTDEELQWWRVLTVGFLPSLRTVFLRKTP